MMKSARRLAADSSASAAAEMAMALPLLLVLLFSAFELGNYFMSEHAVAKAARDAARYASRLSITNYPACDPTASAEQQIQRVARTGQPDGTTSARIGSWTEDSMTTVSLTCEPVETSPYAGIYSVYPFPDGVPVVTVSASVPYQSLFGTLGLGDLSLTLNATSEAAVFAQ